MAHNINSPEDLRLQPVFNDDRLYQERRGAALAGALITAGSIYAVNRLPIPLGFRSALKAGISTLGAAFTGFMAIEAVAYYEPSKIAPTNETNIPPQSLDEQAS